VVESVVECHGCVSRAPGSHICPWSHGRHGRGTHMNNPGLAAGLARRSCRRRKDEPAEPRPFQHSEFSTHHSAFSISLVRRHLIGIIALLSLLGAVTFWIWPPESAWSGELEAACWRGGALASILWLAYTDLRRMPAWFWLSLPVLVAILVVRPRRFLYVIPFIIALAILKPRARRRL